MKVFINPGHAPNGVPDPGAVSDVTGLRECDVALSVGKLVEHYLNAVGIETTVLQSDDLYEVCTEANNLDADLFISIHCNSVESPYAEGTETWYCAGSNDGKHLAECIQSQIVDHLGTVDRELRWQPRVRTDSMSSPIRICQQSLWSLPLSPMRMMRDCLEMCRMSLREPLLAV